MRKTESSDTDTAAEYITMETKNDANPINEVVTRPKGGYGTRTKPVG
jgi:hypothetical protein